MNIKINYCTLFYHINYASNIKYSKECQRSLLAFASPDTPLGIRSSR